MGVVMWQFWGGRLRILEVYVFSSFQNAATQGSGSTGCLGCSRSPVLCVRGRTKRGVKGGQGEDRGREREREK